LADHPFELPIAEMFSRVPTTDGRGHLGEKRLRGTRTLGLGLFKNEGFIYHQLIAVDGEDMRFKSMGVWDA